MSAQANVALNVNAPVDFDSLDFSQVETLAAKKRKTKAETAFLAEVQRIAAERVAADDAKHAKEQADYIAKCEREDGLLNEAVEVEAVEAAPVAPVEVEALASDEAQAVEALAVEVEALAPVEAETVQSRAEKAQALIIGALEIRVQHAPSENFADNMQTEINFLSGRNGLAVFMKCDGFEIDYHEIARCLSVTYDKDKDYFAIYAVQKFRKSIRALALGMTSVFDGYTNSIMKNMCNLQSISNRGATMSLSRSIVFEDSMVKEAIKSYKDCKPSTALTQASSTRMCMHFLNICNVQKGMKDDVMTFKDTLAAKRLIEMYKS